MTELAIWLACGAGWTPLALWMLWAAVQDYRARIHENGMLRIQRKSNVITFALASGGLLCATGAAVLTILQRASPETLAYTRPVVIALLTLVLNDLGLIVLHKWITRAKLDSEHDKEQREAERLERERQALAAAQRRRKHDPPLEHEL